MKFKKRLFWSCCKAKLQPVRLIQERATKRQAQIPKRGPEMGNLVKETPHSEMNATIEVFDHLGVTREHFARMRTDEAFARRITSFMLRGGIDGSVHQKLARALLGQNFFGIEEWSTFHGMIFTKKQLREVTEFPWGEDVLNSPCPWNSGKLVHETHMAFLGLEKFKGEPLTILKWHDIYPATRQPKFFFQ